MTEEIVVVVCDVCAEQVGVTRPSKLVHNADGSHTAYNLPEEES